MTKDKNTNSRIRSELSRPEVYGPLVELVKKLDARGMKRSEMYGAVAAKARELIEGAEFFKPSTIMTYLYCDDRLPRLKAKHKKRRPGSVEPPAAQIDRTLIAIREVQTSPSFDEDTRGVLTDALMARIGYVPESRRIEK